MTIDLEFLGKQTERILTELREIRAELRDLSRRVTGVESAIGLIFSQIATLNNRIDRFEEKRKESES